MTLKEINVKTPEGKLLFAALAILTTSPELLVNGQKIRGSNTTPDEMIEIVEGNATELFKEENWPPSISEQLQPFGAGKATNEPVSFENRLNQYEAILGFVSFLTTKTNGIVLSSGHNPGNVDDIIVSFCIANNLPKPKAGWEKMLRFPE